jgi:uncharacterized protein (DUF1330 family)
MAGYWMVRADIMDPEKQAAYAKLASAAVAKYAGRYLARGGQAESREGRSRERLVIIEFPSYAEAKAAYDSPRFCHCGGAGLASGQPALSGFYIKACRPVCARPRINAWISCVPS